VLTAMRLQVPGNDPAQHEHTQSLTSCSGMVLRALVTIL
jgi:hypothetical protein